MLENFRKLGLVLGLNNFKNFQLKKFIYLRF